MEVMRKAARAGTHQKFRPDTIGIGRMTPTVVCTYKRDVNGDLHVIDTYNKWSAAKQPKVSFSHFFVQRKLQDARFSKRKLFFVFSHSPTI